MFSELESFSPKTQRVWVVADISESELDLALKSYAPPSVIQLHGRESPEKCSHLRQKYPKIISLWSDFLSFLTPFEKAKLIEKVINQKKSMVLSEYFQSWDVIFELIKHAYDLMIV